MKEQPDILLLQETKCAGEEASQILKKCWKQGNLVEIDAKGVVRGLVRALEPSHGFAGLIFFLQLDHHSLLPPHRFEQTWLHHKSLSTHKTGRQGSLPSSLRMDFQSHRHPNMDPWGRFQYDNKIGGKKGGHTLGNDSEQFHRTIGLLNLIDVETNNGPFTWSNRCSGTHHVSSRLDHFLIS
jgi:hypothetical protein